ncbi:hypothetical protein P691DRAFT_626764, partial [Macrolepiota fuliginosa MF-IS2]
SSYKVKISRNLTKRGVHDVFHASLLRIHVPNDDRLFPGRTDSQVWDFGEDDQEWMVNHISGHRGSRSDALFKVEWKSDDTTWLPYHQVSHLVALEHYFELLGISNIEELRDAEG